MPQVLRQHNYKVTGQGVFPYDMLRYDASYPADQESVAMLHSDPFAGPEPLRMRTVTLSHTSDRTTWSPTTDRWQSFGWQVSDIKRVL